MKIRFCMLENKKEISNYESYIESVSNKLKSDFYPDLIFNIEPFSDYDVEVDNSSYIRVDYELGEGIIECFFEFQTFKTLELSVSIDSDNYRLEDFKMKLKKTLINRTGKNHYDWDKCIWIYDSESEDYAKRLYQKIHTMENQLREFIYDVLNKNFGSTWFEDISPYEVFKTATARKGSYKQIAPSFRDVDDSLMLIDTGDLYKIMKAKVLEWNLTDEKEVLKILSSGGNYNVLNELYRSLMKQTEIKIDVWNEYFAELLPTTFEDNFKEFESNRNHVAHNKHLDRDSFSRISNNIKDLEDDISKAYDLFYDKYRSKEYKDYISKKDDLLRERQEQIELEFMESESGVRINDEDIILEEMDKCIYKLIKEFEDNVADRNDLTFSEYTGLIISKTANIYDIKSQINNSKIVILGTSIIDSSPGSESQIQLEVVGKENSYLGSISYQNGSCYFDEEQSTYLPELESGWSVEDFHKVLEKLLDIVDENMPHYKQQVDEKKIDAEDISNTECKYCGKKYVYVGDDLIEYGLCLNCLEIAEFE